MVGVLCGCDAEFGCGLDGVTVTKEGYELRCGCGTIVRLNSRRFPIPNSPAALGSLPPERAESWLRGQAIDSGLVGCEPVQ